MQQTILVFDQEDLGHKHLKKQLKSIFTDSTLQVTADYQLFKREILKGGWAKVFINFESGYFSQITNGDTRQILKSIRNQNEGVSIVGIVGSTSVMKYVRRLQLPTMQKSFSRNDSKTPLIDIDISRISKVVAEHFSIPPENLSIPSRKPEYVEPRQVAMFFAKQFTKLSLKKIAEQYNRKEHTVVLHSERTVLDKMDTNEEFKNLVVSIQNILTPMISKAS